MVDIDRGGRDYRDRRSPERHSRHSSPPPMGSQSFPLKRPLTPEKTGHSRNDRPITPP
jgi:hypothetical protein